MHNALSRVHAHPSTLLQHAGLGHAGTAQLDSLYYMRLVYGNGYRLGSPAASGVVGALRSDTDSERGVCYSIVSCKRRTLRLDEGMYTLYGTLRSVT